MKATMNKLYDYNGEVKGYELNGYYLMKHYQWNSSAFSWIINQTGQTSYPDNAFGEAYDKGEVIIVSSFKAGKEKLIELASR